MKVDNLKLEGFLTYKNKKRFDFDKHNFIVGPNGAGKTTIRNALEWLITGQTRMTKGSQIAEKYLITDDPNTDKAKVSAYFENQDYWAQRDVTNSRSSRVTAKHQGGEIPSGPKSPTKTESEQALIDGLRVTEDIVHYLLDGKDFAELSASERAEELSQLFGANEIQKVENELSSNNDLGDLVENAINEVNGSVEDLVDHLVEERRAAKREKRKYESKLEDIDGEVPDSVTFLDQQYPGKYIINNLDEVEEKLESKKDKLAQIKGKHSVTGKPLEKFEKEISELEDNLEGIGDLEELKKSKTKVTSQIKSLKNRINRAKTGKATCVYDSSCECPVDDDQIDTFKDRAKKKIKKLNSKKDSLSDNISKAQQIEKKIQKLENKKESAISSDELDKMEKLDTKVESAQKKYDKLQSIKEDKQNKNELESKIEECEQNVKDVNDAIEKVEEARETILNNALNDYRDCLQTASKIFGQKFKITDDMDILMNGRPYYALSQSEKLRLQYVNQIALALVTGAGFFALDEVNTLYGDNRIKLLKLLKHYNNEIDFSLIIMSASLDKAPIGDSKIINI